MNRGIGLMDSRIDDSKPNLKEIYNYARDVYRVRYNESYSGNRFKDMQALAKLANELLTTNEMINLIDWYYGYAASDLAYPSFCIFPKVVDSYKIFMSKYGGSRRSGENFYDFCVRCRKVKENKMNDRLQ